MDEVPSGHFVRWEHDSSAIVGKIVCPLPTTAECHQCDDACAHPDGAGPHMECLVSKDIMDIGASFLYCGDSKEVRNDFIDIKWDGADYAWWYQGDKHSSFQEPDLSVVDETLGS